MENRSHSYSGRVTTKPTLGSVSWEQWRNEGEMKEEKMKNGSAGVGVQWNGGGEPFDPPTIYLDLGSS